MSVLYSIIPLDDEHAQQWREYLMGFGIETPIGTVSRYPTPAEIRHVLEEMTEYTTRYLITDKVWHVTIYETAFNDHEVQHITGKHATICSVGPALDESLPLDIYFHSGWDEVNLEIALRLTQYTGSLIFMRNSEAIPLLVSPNDKLADLLDRWQNLDS